MISAHTLVVGEEEGSFKGRVGLLAYDSGSLDVLSISARNICDGKGILHLGDTATANTSGNAAIRKFQQADADRKFYKRADTLLCAIVLHVGAKVDGNLVTSQQVGIKPPLKIDGNVLSKEVWVHAQSEAPRKAKIISTNALFRMPDPKNGEMTVFSDAVEIQNDTKTPVTERGDTGSLVTMGNGAAVGIVVCAVGPSTFVAPLHALFDAIQDLSVLNDEIVTTANYQLTGDDELTETNPKDAELQDETEAKLKLAVEEDDLEAELELSPLIEESFFDA